MIAAQKGHDEIARILLKEGKCKKDQVDAVNDTICIYVGTGVSWAWVYATCV